MSYVTKVHDARCMYVLPSETVCIICMLHVGVGSFICLLNSMKVFSVGESFYLSMSCFICAQIILLYQTIFLPPLVAYLNLICHSVYIA